jgi:hypothetical protein
MVDERHGKTQETLLIINLLLLVQTTLVIHLNKDINNNNSKANPNFLLVLK